KYQEGIIETSELTGGNWRKTETRYQNEDGQPAKIIQYGRDEKIRYIDFFTYYDNGLLKSQEAYRSGDQFSYRFVTTYEME
ncbi:MAG: hypothetical protein AAFP02_12920, partial [Bacteroidota bacterium]